MGHYTYSLLRGQVRRGWAKSPYSRTTPNHCITTYFGIERHRELIRQSPPTMAKTRLARTLERLNTCGRLVLPPIVKERFTLSWRLSNPIRDTNYSIPMQSGNWFPITRHLSMNGIGRLIRLWQLAIRRHTTLESLLWCATAMIGYTLLVE